MRQKTYEVLYQLHLGNVNKDDLMRALSEEEDPFHLYAIKKLLNETETFVPWDVEPFTSKFLSESPRQRLDETFFAFILRLASFLKGVEHLRIFKKPGLIIAVKAWHELFRRILLCSLALLYNVQWTIESVYEVLDVAVIQLLYKDSDGSTLRNLMTRLGIQLAVEEPYPAEKIFYKLSYLHKGQWSSFYWRFLHWMAEADGFRGSEMNYFKRMWREILTTSLYRTLGCPFCRVHYEQAMAEMKEQILDSSVNLSEIFFNIHNRVHEERIKLYRFLQEPNYTKEQYQKDSDFMIQALSP